MMDNIKLSKLEINVSELMKLVSSPLCGAISMFVGTTRDNFDNKVVKRLVYEAYDAMAEKALQKVCENIRSKWKVHGIAIHHRLGEVPVEEASVAIVISSVHRAESLQAVQFAINSLKAEVPIWKKEEYEGDVEPKWKENEECSWIKTEPKDTCESSKGNSINDGNYLEEVPQELIQVRIDDKELKRRIRSFMNYKRTQVNLSNIRDFCCQSNSDSSCARVDAIVVRHKDSKGHLRVRRVLNPTGPQTQFIQTELRSPSKHRRLDNMVANCDMMNFSSPIEERLHDAEMKLQLHNNPLQPVSKDIYARLKEIEDRILFLEGVSPEYSQILSKPTLSEPSEYAPNHPKKKVYSVSDLNLMMKDLEHKME